MKEAFDKMIERLEEEREWSSTNGKDVKFREGRLSGLRTGMRIVKEVAEEYKDKYITVPKDDFTEHLINMGYNKGLKDANNDGWIPCSERLPDGDRQVYIVQATNGIIDALGFTKDAFKLDKYAFAEYKGKKKSVFYEYDPEYGYIEYECEAWRPLPAPYKPKEN